MNTLKALIAAGLISIGYGARKVYADGEVTVPSGTEIVNIGQFRYDLHAPLDSLKVKVGVQDVEIRIAEANGDTVGLFALKERTEEECEKLSRLEKVVESVEDSTLYNFETYNAAINDNVLTAQERMLLSDVRLGTDAVEEYREIAGDNSYNKLKGAVERYNQGVLALNILAEEDATGEIFAEPGTTPESDVEADEGYDYEDEYTDMKREVALGAASYNNDMVGGFARATYGLNNKHRLGVGIEYGEQINKDANTLATQRNPITGARLEASETRDRSRLEAGLEWSYNIGDSPFSLRAVLGAGRITLDKEVSEKLYKKDNTLFGPGNKDHTKDREWYGKFLPGFGLTSGNVNIEGYLGVVDKKAELRTRVGYKF
ncbi:MAG: hypothetical protein AABX49_02715 [Nanoarchaeota archaeon]